MEAARAICPRPGSCREAFPRNRSRSANQVSTRKEGQEEANVDSRVPNLPTEAANLGSNLVGWKGSRA